ncbi:MAG: hypothetical protein MUD10_01980 [Candidatus Pacebacteria bacterium]|jgi:hypothetical protein|nr:hypothetical protein [Candidatus Paceibacterota bacterium]
MDLGFLQKKYPEFVYENYFWKTASGDLTAVFRFTMGDIEFSPEIVIRGVDKRRIAKIGKSVVDNLVFHMGLAEIPSYWKSACPPTVVIRAGYMDKKQTAFWSDLIANMGQFFYENDLPFIKPEFRVECAKIKPYPAAFKDKVSDRCLVPLGGGKDSLVTLEVLRDAKKQLATFTLNANAALVRVAVASEARNIAVERKIDKKIVELNKLGYLNGHTPFSAILSVMSVGLAAIFDCNQVAISQERSSNEGNVKYRNRTVNHQYTKTFDFENKFREYAKKYLVSRVDYYSFLRPLYELQIAGIFARRGKYFDTFLSCNRSFTISARENRIDSGWCGKCSKCLSIFSMLYPFVGKEAAVKIFGRDMFDDAGMLETMRELTGQSAVKPFECVGTREESLVAFYLSSKVNSGRKPYLLEYFEKNILPHQRNMERRAKKILTSWNKNHNLPKPFAARLKKEIDACGKLELT